MHRIARLASLAVLTAVLLAVPVSSASAAANWTWVKKGKLANVGGSLDAVDCPSTQLCVAGGGKAIFVTTAAAARAGSWKRIALSQPHATLGGSYIYEVTCPTITFCAIGDSNTNVITSTTPRNAVRSSWLAREIPNTGIYAGIGGLSCSSPTLCAASDYNGGAMNTIAPATGIWSVRGGLSPVLNAGIYDVDCTGSTCISVQSDRDVWVTTDATVQPAVWTKRRLGANASRTFSAVACQTPTLCVAAGTGPLRVTTNVAGGPATWRSIPLAGESRVEHVNCRPGLCTATAGTDVWWTATPAIARSWKKSTIPRTNVILSDSSCPTPRICVVTDVGGNVFYGTR